MAFKMVKVHQMTFGILVSINKYNGFMKSARRLPAKCPPSAPERNERTRNEGNRKKRNEANIIRVREKGYSHLRE